MDTWNPRNPDVEVSQVLASIQGWLAECDGVTISGGEPFDQPDALEAVVKGIRQLSGGSVLVYSGHPYASISSQHALASGLIDALITEPFDVTAKQTLALRGSDNQQLHLLTAVGRREFARYECDASAEEKHLDFMVGVDGTVWLAGIPQRGDMRKLQAILAEQGVVTTVTEGRT